MNESIFSRRKRKKISFKKFNQLTKELQCTVAVPPANAAFEPVSKSSTESNDENSV